MNGHLLILALAAVATGCVQAALTSTLPGDQFPVRVPPMGYNDFQAAPPAPVPVYPHDSYYEHPNLAPVQHQQPQQPQQPINGPGGKATQRLGKNLRELTKIGAQTVRNAFTEAKPTLNEMRSDFNELGQRIANNPRIQKVTQSLGAHLDSARERAVPLLQRGKSHLNKAIHYRPQGANGPNGGYPAPQANAVEPQ